MTNPPSGSVTASVGEPTPLPERPTLYAAIRWNNADSDWSVKTFRNAEYADAYKQNYEKVLPGIEVVPIPGSASPPAPSSELVRYKLGRVEQWGDTIASPGIMSMIEDRQGPYYLASAVDPILAATDARISDLEQQLATYRRLYNASAKKEPANG